MTGLQESALGLIEQLGADDDWRTRRQAALRLARVGRDNRVLAALTAALDDRDPDVRHAAVIALGEVGDPQAVEVLCRPKLLGDPSATIRWATVTAIGRLGDLSVVNVLSRALEDPDWVVHNQALLAISDFIRRIPDTVDGDQIKSLMRLLSIPDSEVRSLVVDALSRRSTRGLDEMVEAMKMKSRVVRAGVAEALGLSRDPRAVGSLIDATNDPVSAVRREAARGLGRLGDSLAVEPLIVLLGDSDRATTAAAVQALVTFGDAAVDAVCTALKRTVPKLHRRNAILVLGGIRALRAIVPLLNSLSSTYYVVRQAAITALSSYGEEVVDDLIDMVHVSPVPLEPLLRDALEQSNKRLRLRAIRALGELKNAAAVKPIRALMKDPDRDIIETTQASMSKIGLAAWARYGAVIALGNIGGPKTVPALILALGDHSEYVRLEAARGLAKLADPVSIAPLIDTLESDEDAAVRREAAFALRILGEQSPVVAHAFRQALQDESWEVRVEAARALGRIDDEASVDSLVAALVDSSYTVTTSAEHALANLGRIALPRLLEVSGGPASPALEPALSALAELLGEERGIGVEALADKPQAERRAALEKLAGGA